MWKFIDRKMFVDLSYNSLCPTFISYLAHTTCYIEVVILAAPVMFRRCQNQWSPCISRWHASESTLMAGPGVFQRNYAKRITLPSPEWLLPLMQLSVTWFIRPGNLSLRINCSPMLFCGPFDSYWADQDHHSKAAVLKTLRLSHLRARLSVFTASNTWALRTKC